MSRSKNFTVTGRRSRAQRLTPAGWFLLLFAIVMGLLLLFGGVRWVLRQWPAWFPPEATPAVVTPAPTVAATPESTATPVAEVAFPAWWAEGMTQDAKGAWWPAEDAREQVQQMVAEQYVEIVTTLGNRPENETLNAVTDDQARYYQTGEILDEWFRARKRFMDTGRFMETIGVVTERTVMVQAFSPDGLTCQVGETYLQAHRLRYDAQTQTWNRVDLDENGMLDGVQYLGVVVSEMQYDQEDGRWKLARFLQWIPRP